MSAETSAEGLAQSNRTPYITEYQIERIAAHVAAWIRKDIQGFQRKITDLENQVKRVGDAVGTPALPIRVVSVEEALRITGHKTASGFRIWASKVGLSPCSPRHFLVDQIEHALRLNAARFRIRRERSKSNKLERPG